MLFMQDVAYAHPNKDVLFRQLNITINKNEKVALIGQNGVGKSTLLKLMSGQLQPVSGTIRADSAPYYIPQLTGQLGGHTVAEALGIDQKVRALRGILNGNASPENLELLADDWGIEERCQEAFAHWELAVKDLLQPMQTLSGGQKTKVLLAGIRIHRPEIVLMDEPSNHLDLHAREMLYEYVASTSQTLVIVSHDRQLLHIPQAIFELSRKGITVYGGNYDFYTEQKTLETGALENDIRSREKALRKAKEVERESAERQQKLDARGKKKQEKAGVPRITLNTLRNNAENSTSKMKDVHAEKTAAMAREVNLLRSEMPGTGKMKIDFDHSALHKGKILVRAEAVQFAYSGQQLWCEPLDTEIVSGERIAIRGRNGSGKTTFVKMVSGALQPASGKIQIASKSVLYIDQDYSLINESLSVIEQVQQFNSGALQEHEVKIRLNRYLFGQNTWTKPCSALSGGEKMRLILCSLSVQNQAPDMIILDEPTNNLDIQNIEILTAAFQEYEGTLLVISHDARFLNEIGIDRTIHLD